MPDQNEQLQRISSQLSELNDTVVAYAKRIEKLEKWVMGDFTVDGKPIPGLLVTVSQIAGLRTWVISLGSTTAAGVLVNAALSFLHYVGVLPR